VTGDNFEQLVLRVGYCKNRKLMFSGNVL